VRFRENTEAVAFYRGEDGERLGAKSRFHRVVDNWLRLIRAQRNLALCTIGLGQTNSIVPLLVAAPGYFLGRLTLGDVIQTNIAYAQVSGALVWFVNAYQEIAHWRASVERLFSFSEAIDESHAELAHNVGIDFEANPEPAIRLDDLRVELPNGRALLDGLNQSIAAGDKLLLTGPSGSGKSTLFRTLAGLWPFGHGRVEIPEKGKKLFLPQHPYLPMGTLRAAASYPSCEGTFSDERIEEVLRQVGLERFHGRLSEDAHWEQQMSGGEQQQLAFARVLLHRPDWVFLDEATAALDEATEERVYELLEDQLPDATVVSIAHRPGVAQYHRRRWTLVPRDGHMSIEAA
jgi:vitamin B12/bleomycin/antimicrobial peptide transport system ATP-binding/permease protein